MTRFIILFTISIFMFSCGGESTANETPATPETPKEEVKKKVKIKKAEVTISESPKGDYPEIFLKNSFPIMSGTEISGIGNTVIGKDSGATMKLNTHKTIAELEKFYTDNLTTSGWTKKTINVYKGATSAIAFNNDKYVMQIISINEEDQNYRKVAIVMTNKPAPITE